ncbi:GGDEF domain-containing protein [Candidatus Falkowbacteria bacterium]|nr:GGDEF domain-containing protein [Candidatus Falkowbacteria bacterium]
MEFLNQPWFIQVGFGLSFALIVVAFFYIRGQRQRIKQLREELDGWMKDALTGLASRRRAMEMYHWMFKIVHSARARQGGLHQRKEDGISKSLTLAMFDIDHFKKVNDEHGHLAGDMVLEEFGKILSAQIRASDIAGRYGGEEFFVVLAADVDGMKIFVERVRQELGKKRFQHKGKKFGVTFTCGIATLDDPQCTCEELLERADSALLNGKEYRNRVVLWTPERFIHIQF